MPDEKPNQDATPTPAPEVTPSATPAPAQAPVKEEKPTPPAPGSTPVPAAPETPQFIEFNGEKIPIEELKSGYMRQKDYTQKTQELADYKRKIETISEAISPKPVPVPSPVPQALTKEELDTILSQRDAQKEQEIALKTEIQTLSKEYAGTDGRPKYEDSEILKWQTENKKLYLSPREAYEAKYKPELLEWEIKNRMKKAGKEVYQEKPGGGVDINLPTEKKVFVTATKTGALIEDAEGRKQAILETMNNLETE